MKRQPTTADEILDAAGGCPTLRRTVFHYLDRFEALRLADAGPSWRSAASESVSWLPGLLQYLHSQSTRSITVSNEELEQKQQQQQHSSSSPANPLNRQRSNPRQQQRSRSPNASNTSSGGGRRSPNSSNSGRRSPLLLSPTTRSPSGGRSPVSAPLLLQPGGGGGGQVKLQFRRGTSRDDDDDDHNLPTSPGSGGSYVAPNCTTEAGHGLFTPFARQHIARSAFGPTHVYSGNPIPGDVLASLWNLTSPELYFLVAQAFRRPPREMALILEHCDKLVGLAIAGQASAVHVTSMMTNVQSQIFLALQLICHPLYEKRTERRFLVQFPCTLILLRCANILRISGFEWKVPPSLTNALLAPSYFQQQSYREKSSSSDSINAANLVSGRNLPPTVLLLSEMMRWHDVEPMREHAPWFASLATWASTAPTIWTDLPFHATFTLPHILTLKSLAIAPSEVPSDLSQQTTTQQQQQQQQQQRSEPNSPLADAAYDGTAQQEEEMKELSVVRTMLRRSIDAEAIVKAVVQSALDMALFYYRKEQGLLPTVLNMGKSANGGSGAAPSSSPTAAREKMMGEITKRVALAFHALAKMETLIKSVVWAAPTPRAEAALQDKYATRYIEAEVEFAWSQLGNSQAGINRLFDARGKLAEAQQVSKNS